MSWKISAAVFFAVSLSCVRETPDWYTHQDRSIEIPPFDATTPADFTVDGVTMQALRVAIDDSFPPSAEPQACAYTLAAHRFKVSRDGGIVFVEISQAPEVCDWKGFGLDGRVRYAIGSDGRILRRALDGEQAGAAFAGDAGRPWELLPLKPDGGVDFRTPPPCPLGPHAPVSLFPNQHLCETVVRPEHRGREPEVCR